MSFDNETYIEQKSCPVCLSGSRFLEEMETMNPKSPKMVGLRECISCKHWWNDPLPDQKTLDNFYQSDSPYMVPLGYSSSMSTALTDDFISFYQKTYDEGRKYSAAMSGKEKSFNYLEVGSGSGGQLIFFLKKARLAYGIEPGSWGHQVPKEHLVKSIKELPKEVSFDMIVAHDVLEHLSSPSSTLGELNALARDGCVIHATFPNKDALKAKLQKSRWHMVRPFGHLHYFSRRSVHMLFKKSGFDIVSLKKCRISKNTALDLLKNFDTKGKLIVYRFFKSLILGQMILGKDQWKVIAVKRANN